MTVALQLQSPFTAVPTGYDESGGGRSLIPFCQTLKLPGSTSKATVITFRPTASTAADLPDDIVLADSLTNPIAMTTTHAPLTGSGYVSLDKLRALQIVLTADEVNSAEREAEVTGSRVATVLATLSAGSGAIVYFTEVKLAVTSAGQIDFFAKHFPDDLPTDTTLTLTVESFDLLTKLRIFAAMES